VSACRLPCASANPTGFKSCASPLGALCFVNFPGWILLIFGTIIAREGGYLLFNNFEQKYYNPWKDMLYLMRAVFDQEYGIHLLISLGCNWEWEKGGIVFESKDESYLDPNASKRTPAYMMRDVVPAMLKAGFNQKEIDRVLIQNPRRYFS
jgi:predicted metal-dependent phosphotriesterase family hydrolase